MTGRDVLLAIEQMLPVGPSPAPVGSFPHFSSGITATYTLTPPDNNDNHTMTSSSSSGDEELNNDATEKYGSIATNELHSRSIHSNGKRIGGKVIELKVNGETIDLDKIYHVASKCHIYENTYYEKFNCIYSFLFTYFIYLFIYVYKFSNIILLF